MVDACSGELVVETCSGQPVLETVDGPRDQAQTLLKIGGDAIVYARIKCKARTYKGPAGS